LPFSIGNDDATFVRAARSRAAHRAIGSARVHAGGDWTHVTRRWRAPSSEGAARAHLGSLCDGRGGIGALPFAAAACQ
jgi:hypothetical protein